MDYTFYWIFLEINGSIDFNSSFNAYVVSD